LGSGNCRSKGKYPAKPSSAEDTHTLPSIKKKGGPKGEKQKITKLGGEERGGKKYQQKPIILRINDLQHKWEETEKAQETGWGGREKRPAKELTRGSCPVGHVSNDKRSRVGLRGGGEDVGGKKWRLGVCQNGGGMM